MSFHSTTNILHKFSATTEHKAVYKGATFIHLIPIVNNFRQVGMFTHKFHTSFSSFLFNFHLEQMFSLISNQLSCATFIYELLLQLYFYNITTNYLIWIFPESIDLIIRNQWNWVLLHLKRLLRQREEQCFFMRIFQYVILLLRFYLF